MHYEISWCIMKLENATVGLEVIVKPSFYVRQLCGVKGKIESVTSGGVIEVVFDKKYPIFIAQGTLGYNTDRYSFLPNHLKRVK